ncbi:unnamed protein product [Trichobilharzia szidati]|nr:unnamed protein product [Trichobilharzia szidati]
MSHRREAGAVPPWVIPEEHARCSPRNKINQQSTVEKSPLNQVENVNNINNNNSNCKVNMAAGDSNSQQTPKAKKEQVYIMGGQLVNSDHIQYADILIEDGKVVSTGKNIQVGSDALTIDASGMLIMPGGIDMATYLVQDVHSLDKEAYLNVTKEALIGGTTTIVDTILCPKGSSAIELLTKYKSTMKDTKLWCDIIIRIGFLEIHESQLNEIDDLTRIHGINSFLFIIDPVEMNKTNKDSVLITNLLAALEKCKESGSIVFIKSYLKTSNLDNKDDLELKSIEKIIFLANTANCPVVISSPNGLKTIEEVSEARRRIPPAHMTVCCTPNALQPTTTKGQQYANRFLSRLTNGDITLISSDHSGVNSSDTIGKRLTTIWEVGVPSGWLDATSFVNIISANAARYLGLYPSKGCLSPGSDADLILWPSDSITRCGVGKPALVIHHGKLIVHEGKLIDNNNNTSNNTLLKITPINKLNEFQSNQPCGLLKTGKTFPPTIYGLVKASERLRKRNQMPIDREPWTMNNLNESLLNSQQSSNTLNNGTNNNAIVTPNSNDEQKITDKVQNSTSSLNVRTIHGHRDLHASGFSLSGAQVDDDQPLRTGIRTRQTSESRNPLW